MANDRVCECKLFVNFSRSMKSQTEFWWFLPLYNGQFSEKIWGIRCKFSVNFHRDFFPLTIQRTFFRLMIGYANVNFLLIFLAPEKAKQSFDDSFHFTTEKFLKNFNPRLKNFPLHITTYIFSSKSRYLLKNFLLSH